MVRKAFVIMFFAALLTAAVSAQQGQLATEEFSVVRGSTMWDLAAEKCGDPLRWEEVFGINVRGGRLPADRLSYNEAGEPMALIRPSERILVPVSGCQLASDIVEPVTPAVASADPALLAELAAVRRAVEGLQPGLHWLWLVAFLSVLLLIAAAVWYGVDRLRRQMELNREAFGGHFAGVLGALQNLTPQAVVPVPAGQDAPVVVAGEPAAGIRRVTIDSGHGRAVVHTNGLELSFAGHDVAVQINGARTYIARDGDDAAIVVDARGRLRAMSLDEPVSVVMVPVRTHRTEAAQSRNGGEPEPAGEQPPPIDWEGEWQQRREAAERGALP